MNFERTFETVQLLIAELADRFETPQTDRIDVFMHDAKDLNTAAAGLRVKRLGNLVAITGLDPGEDSPDLEALYHFSSGPIVITLRFQLPKESAVIDSLCEIIPSAEPFERELSEMFGITITGLPTPDYLYLPDDWIPGIYPLRKEYHYDALTD